MTENKLEKSVAQKYLDGSYFKIVVFGFINSKGEDHSF